MLRRPAIPACLALLLMGADGGAQTLVVEAARHADWKTLHALILQGSSANATEADGTTALHWVSYHDDLKSAELLLKAGAPVNAANDLGATPLWTASQNGSVAMVHRLLIARADPNLALLSGETPLMVASRSGYPEVVEELLAKGAKIEARASRGQTALMWAVAQKHADVVQILVEHGANITARSDVWSDVMAVPPHGLLENNRSIPHGGDTAVLFAARVGDMSAAKILVAAGADVNDRDAWGITTTVLAAHSGFTELVEFLLDHGADPNLAPAGFTALHEAIMRRDQRMVGALLKHGANPNTPVGAWTPTRRDSKDWNFHPGLVGATPFWLAARFDEPAIMHLLVKHGADPLFIHRAVYSVDGRGGKAFEQRTELTTAVMAAVGMSRATAWAPIDPGQREALTLDAVRFAAELGVDVNGVNTDGRTALDAAEDLKYETVVKFLSGRGARKGTRETSSGSALTRD